ncbi:hypothetical protein MAP00_000072 [Monascus purpureus]|nr:hypothetical protein MAP00_000072 [Monascus purpureus]
MLGHRLSESGDEAHVHAGNAVLNADNYTFLDPGVYSSRESSPSRRLLLCMVVSQSVIILLLVIICIRLFPFMCTPCPLQEQGWNDTVQYSYGVSEEYMTLDHKFDYLWSETDSSPLIESTGPDGQPQRESISMFHQLHCLASIRMALQESRENKDVGMDWRDNAHWPHCLDYLRQTILCFADDTLEHRDRLPNGTTVRFISGTQDVRRCRSSERLYALRAEKGISVSQVDV